MENQIETLPDAEEGSEQNLKDPDVKEYDYTKAGHFTSEIYKILVANLPKYFAHGECKKLMSKKLKLKPHKICIIKHANRGFITFKNEEDKQEAMEKLNGYVLRGKKLEVKNAPPKQDAMSRKRYSTQDVKEPDQKKTKSNENDTEDTLSPEELLKNNVIPWHNMEYNEQLKKKEESVRDTLSTIRRQIGAIKQLDLEVFKWIMTLKKEGGQCCPVRAILPSPVEEKYRNKCGFTIGKDSHGNVMTGFRYGKYRDLDCAVGSSACLIHITDKMKEIVSCFNEYLKLSKFKVHDLFDHTGYWKQLFVRQAIDNSVMVLVTLVKQDMSDDDLKSEQTLIAKHFESNGISVDTLLLQVVGTNRGFDMSDGPPVVVTGNGVIFEKLFDLKFQISPNAFFQCNTLAAEVLYTCVKDMVLKSVVNQTEYASSAKDLKDTILLDICCGTGTIGLSLAKHVKKVIGVEMCKPAVEDAKVNAKINNIENAEFHCGKAEDILSSLVLPFSLSHTDDVVAVVDPPRCGLHQKVIRTIRQCVPIKKLVYVSCSIEQAKNNILDLCRPQSKRLIGRAFKPVLAQPLDLFPHTKHCEVVILFERIAPPKVDAEIEAKVTETESKNTESEKSLVAGEGIGEAVDSVCEKMNEGDENSPTEKEPESK